MFYLKSICWIQFCVSLSGLILFTCVLSEDCTEPGKSVFVKRTHNITFEVQVKDLDFHPHDLFYFYYILNSTRERICRMDIETHRGRIMDVDCLSGHKNRTSVKIFNWWPDYLELHITIAEAEHSDNGTYLLSSVFESRSWCFTVYILGSPITEIVSTPVDIEDENQGHLKCLSKSTTVPETHNLTIQISWYCNSQYLDTGGRFKVENEELTIYFLSKADIDLVITCKAKEEMGLMTSLNTTIPIQWGPESVPVLEPPKLFYLVESNEMLPDIHCSASCNPTCELVWIGLESQRVLSQNGTLSLGKTSSNSTGDYSCTATRIGVSKQRTITIFVLVKETKAVPPEFSQNYTPVAAVGGSLGAALLLTIIFVAVVLIRRNAFVISISRKSVSKQPEVSVEMGTQNRSYEAVTNDGSTRRDYDTLNTGLNKEASTRSRNYEDFQSGQELYENAALN